MSLIDTNKNIKHNNETYPLSIYKNIQLNRWYDTNDVSEIIKNMNKIEITNTKIWNIYNDNHHPLKRYHDYSVIPSSSSTKKVPFQQTYLSNDNIRLMDACDFKGGNNFVTDKQCIESFISKLENDYIEEENNKQSELSLDDKIYLTICSAAFVYLLFKLSDKYNM
jgi:hypothetical protein